MRALKPTEATKADQMGTVTEDKLKYVSHVSTPGRHKKQTKDLVPVFKNFSFVGKYVEWILCAKDNTFTRPSSDVNRTQLLPSMKGR